MTALRMWRCERCLELVFPRRELCPRCGFDAFAEQPVSAGAVTESTSHRGTAIACVEVEGTRVLARAAGAVPAGTQVRLLMEDGAPVAVSR